MKDRQFLVTKVKPDADMTGVEVDGKKMDFSKSGYSFFLKDAGMAKDMDQTVGSAGTKDVVITEMPRMNKSQDGVHNYTFTVQKPITIQKDPEESKYEWIEIEPGKKRLVLKEKK